MQLSTYLIPVILAKGLVYRDGGSIFFPFIKLNREKITKLNLFFTFKNIMKDI